MAQWFRVRVLSLVALVVLVVVAVTLVACGGGAGAAGSTARQASAASAKLIIMSDIVQGSKNVPQDQLADRGCVLSSRFPRNSQMVFRARVYDPVTGGLMDSSTLTSVQVHLANGVTFDMKYGQHPKTPPNEYYWTGSWLVPKDQPTGTLTYTIIATDKQGRTGEFKPFGIQSSIPTITSDVLPDATGQ
jgi:hypothetical protein